MEHGGTRAASGWGRGKGGLGGEGWCVKRTRDRGTCLPMHVDRGEHIPPASGTAAHSSCLVLSTLFCSRRDERNLFLSVILEPLRALRARRFLPRPSCVCRPRRFCFSVKRFSGYQARDSTFDSTTRLPFVRFFSQTPSPSYPPSPPAFRNARFGA